MEPNISLLFVAIGLLIGTIGILEKNYMFGIDNHVDKFNEKHNVNIDKAIYCKFEAIQRLKTVAGLLILNVIYFLFEIENLKTMVTIILIYGIIDIILYYVKRKKFINKLKSQI